MHFLYPAESLQVALKENFQFGLTADRLSGRALSGRMQVEVGQNFQLYRKLKKKAPKNISQRFPHTALGTQHFQPGSTSLNRIKVTVQSLNDSGQAVPQTNCP